MIEQVDVDSDLIPKKESPTFGGVARNTFLNYINTIFGLVSGIFISVILARSLGPERLGNYSYITFIVGISISVFSLGIGATIVKILSEYTARFGAQVVTRIVRLFAFGVFLPALIATAGTWGCLLLFSHGKSYALSVVIIATLSTFPIYLSQIYRSIVTGFQEFGYLLRVNLLASVLLLVGTLSVARFYPTISLFLLVGIVANLFIFITIFFHYRNLFFRRIRPEPLPKKNIAEVITYLWPVAIISILDLIVWQYSEVLFLGFFRSAPEVAFYTIAFTTANILLRSMAASITSAFMPALSHLYGLGQSDRIKLAFFTGFRLLLILLVPLVTVVAMTAKQLIGFFYGSQYIISATFVPALVLAAGMGAVTGVGADVLYSIHRQRTLLKLATFGAIVNILLDLLLIPQHGIGGAVTANVTAQLAQVICASVVLFLYFRELPARRSIFGPLFAGGLSCLALWPIVRHSTGLGSILMSAVIGSIVYIIGLRLTSAIMTEDAQLILILIKNFPGKTRKAAEKLVDFCVPGVAPSHTQLKNK